MDRLFGLPAHPLVVHIPVAMLPLAVLGTLVMMIRHTWYLRYRWAVLVVATIGMVGAFIATSSGEALESEIRQKEGSAAARAVHEHAEAGEIARTWAVVYWIVLALWVLVPWWLDRRAATRAEATTESETEPVVVHHGPRWLRPVLMLAVAATAVTSMVTIIDAGHSGASKAWEEYNDDALKNG